MNEPIERPRRALRIPLWWLIALPVLCAPIFFGVAFFQRVHLVPRYEREYHWTMRPLEGFSPEQGERVDWGEDIVVKISSQTGPYQGRYYGQSRWATSEGKVQDVWHSDADAGGEIIDAPPQLLANLPDLLKKLPPSDPEVPPENRLRVAFPIEGTWQVRIYRQDALPEAVRELAKALNPPGR